MYCDYEVLCGAFYHHAIFFQASEGCALLFALLFFIFLQYLQTFLYLKEFILVNWYIFFFLWVNFYFWKQFLSLINFDAAYKFSCWGTIIKSIYPVMVLKGTRYIISAIWSIHKLVYPNIFGTTIKGSVWVFRLLPCCWDVLCVFLNFCVKSVH